MYDSLEAQCDGMPGIVIQNDTHIKTHFICFWLDDFLSARIFEMPQQELLKEREKENDLIVCQPNQARNIF